MGVAQVIYNPSLSSYKVRITKNGKLIHNRVLKTHEQFKIESEPTDKIEFYFKVYSYKPDCNNQNGIKETNSTKSKYGPTITLKNGWEMVKIKPCKWINEIKFEEEIIWESGWYYIIYLLPLVNCIQV